MKQICCKRHWRVHNDICHKFHPVKLAKVVAEIQQWDGREAMDQQAMHVPLYGYVPEILKLQHCSTGVNVLNTERKVGRAHGIL